MKTLKKSFINEPNELAVWQLADDGWRTVLRQQADALSSDSDRTLNTPKPEKVKEFFDRNVGVRDISVAWTWPKNSTARTTKRLEEFVTLRGSIAHRGSPNGGVVKRRATDGLDLIRRLAAASAQHVSEHLETHTGAGLAASTTS